MSSDKEWSAVFEAAPTSALMFYDEIMVPRMFDPWAELLLDQLDPQRGQALLDVACGPGTVTRRAAVRVGPRGRVVGCDLSPSMLEIARSKPAPHEGAPIDYLECSADSLLVPDDSFDLVTCQQGLQFFPDRPAALAEMKRAARSGAKVGIATWCAIEECPPFAALAEALGQVLGADIASAYEGGPWGFGDPDVLVRLATEAGFTDVEVRQHQLPLVFEGGAGQLLLTLHATSVATTVAQLPDADRTALSAALGEASRAITLDSEVRSHATANVLTARVGDK